MSLKLARSLQTPIRNLRREIQGGDPDWTALSLVEESPDYQTALKFFGKQRLEAAGQNLAKLVGKNLQVSTQLKRKQVEFFDPISGQNITATKSIVFRKYQFYFFLSGDEPGFLVNVGSRPVSIFYLNRKVWLDIVRHSERHYDVMGCLLQALAKVSRPFFRYLSQGEPVQSACIVGDERPTHFIRESLGGIQDLIDKGKSRAFWDGMDYLIVPSDYAFLLADEVFDVPSRVKVVYLPLSEVNRFIISKNLFANRMMRTGSRMSETLRQRLTDYAIADSPVMEWPEVSKFLSKNDRVNVWFSVEVEKGRLQNQEDVFAVLSRFLKKHFGNRVNLIVDGWSTTPLNFTKKDQRLFDDIRTFIKDNTAKNAVDFTIIDSFSMGFREKIKLAENVDFFVTMHGSAAIVPSLIWKKPGITYHSALGQTIDHEVWTGTLYRAVTTDLDKDPESRSAWSPFRVDPERLEQTLEQVVTDYGITGASHALPAALNPPPSIVNGTL